MRNIHVFIMMGLALAAQARKPVPASRFEQLTGKKLSGDTKSMWDKVYNRSQFVYGKTPAQFLSLNYSFLPEGSKVLDIGMGEGRNAVFLAKKGYQVTGIDISKVAIKKAQLFAKEYDVKLKTVNASISNFEFLPGEFDAIIWFYFVDRQLIPKVLKWLKPGGIIIYEAYTEKQKTVEKDKEAGVEHESLYLKEGELLNLFKDYKILKFEEPEHQENFRSSIIAKKRN